MRKKRTLALTILPAMFAFTAYASAAVWPEACGKDAVQFKVKTDKKQPTLGTPDPGKAQIIFVESVQGPFFSAPVARFGLDGAWVGADRGLSYFAVSVDPGEHHLCASWQASTKEDKENVGVATLNAVAGQTYFYEFKMIRTEIGSPELVASGGVPGSVTNRDVKDKPTADSVSFEVLDENQGRTRLKLLAASSFTEKH
jgi:hypothetical protein